MAGHPQLGTILIPDTVVVINRTLPTTDYNPLIIGLSAPILVAIAAGINTFVQRRIADKAVETQRQLSADAIAVQRETAKQTVATQLEIARKENVVQSRLEWGRDLRATVSKFLSIATSLHLMGQRQEDKQLRLDDTTSESVSEYLRLASAIKLCLDLNKENHRAINRTIGAITDWAWHGPQVKVAQTAQPDTGAYENARQYKDLGAAMIALNNQISDLLESNWAKIKAGE